MNSPILLAYSMDGEGGGEKLECDVITQKLHDDELAWVHLDACMPETKTWLEENVTYLDHHIIDALLAEETRPRMTQLDDGLMIILRGVNLNENADPEDMVSVRLWVDEHRIISMGKRPLKALRDIETQITKGNAPKDAGAFICNLTARLFARMEPALLTLDEETDDIEESILECADSIYREKIIGVRKSAIMFKRYMAPQRDAIGKLHMSDISWLNASHRRHLQESYNHITRYVEDLDAIRERAQIVKDELANILSDRLNKNMYMLSIIAAIFLPLGFLTGLLGINVGGIPGSDNPYAFWVFMVILAVIVYAQVKIFRRLNWF